MMKFFYRTLLVVTVLAAPFAWADEEVLIDAVEYERLIINWQPNAQRLATVLAYECDTCSPRRLEINPNTELQDENGELLLIGHLSNKVDWAGTIQTLSNNPKAIIKIMLH